MKPDEAFDCYEIDGDSLHEDADSEQAYRKEKKSKQQLIRILPKLIDAAEEMEREQQTAVRR